MILCIIIYTYVHTYTYICVSNEYNTLVNFKISGCTIFINIQTWIITPSHLTSLKCYITVSVGQSLHEIRCCCYSYFCSRWVLPSVLVYELFTVSMSLTAKHKITILTRLLYLGCRQHSKLPNVEGDDVLKLWNQAGPLLYSPISFLSHYSAVFIFGVGS
jgi:hypothetical protein